MDANIQARLDQFHGEWASALPYPLDGYRAGAIPLFSDTRVDWAIGTLGGVAGASVLELGSLEGGHAYMLGQYGATVTGVEAGPRAYQRCLLLKELLRMDNVEFVHGDFNQVLEGYDSVDVVFASEVLYHMVDPVRLLQRISRVANRIYLWTHYYDEKLMPDWIRSRFTTEGIGLRRQLHRYSYEGGQAEPGFCGGIYGSSRWMELDDIIEALAAEGFGSVTIGLEEPKHPHGPAVGLVARRTLW